MLSIDLPIESLFGGTKNIGENSSLDLHTNSLFKELVVFTYSHVSYVISELMEAGNSLLFYG